MVMSSLYTPSAMATDASISGRDGRGAPEAAASASLALERSSAENDGQRGEPSRQLRFPMRVKEVIRAL